MLDQIVFASEVSAGDVAGQQCRHEFDGVMRFEVGRLERQHRVGGRVAFVEAVASELDDHVPQVLSFFFAEPVFHGAGHVLFIVLRDQRFFLFTDRFNTSVRSGKANVADPVEDLHHLFLIDHDAVSLFQDLLHRFGLILGFLPPVFDLDVVLDHAAFKRTGTIESVGRDDVAEMIRLHFLKQVANTATLQLKYALRFAALQQREGIKIIQRKLQRVDVFSGGLLHQRERVT